MSDSTDPTLPEDPLAAMAEISGRLGTISEALVTVRDYERRTRRLVIALAISFAVDIALTVTVTVLAINASNQGDALHTSQINACQVGNQVRAEEITLWGYVVSLAEKGPNPNQAQLRQLQAFIDKTFAPANCAQLYP